MAARGNPSFLARGADLLRNNDTAVPELVRRGTFC